MCLSSHNKMAGSRKLFGCKTTAKTIIKLEDKDKDLLRDDKTDFSFGYS